MTDLKLEEDEGILLQTTNAERYSEDNELSVDELYLTNKNLIVIYDSSTGLFSKPKTEIIKVPLMTIRIVNENPQVSIIDDIDYGDVLQIVYKSGKRELFKFFEAPKKEYPKWKQNIIQETLKINGITTKPLQMEEETKNYDNPIEKLQSVFSDAKAKVEAKAKDIKEKTGFQSVKLENEQKNTSENLSRLQYIISGATAKITNGIKEKASAIQLEANKKKNSTDNRYAKFCSNCGHPLEKNVKFCSNCGNPIKQPSESNIKNNEGEK